MDILQPPGEMMSDPVYFHWLSQPKRPAGRILIINSSRAFCAKSWTPMEARWGPAGDYALALEAMIANNLEILEVVAGSLHDVRHEADLYLLRDWRYSEGELNDLHDRFPRARTILDLRIQVFEIHSSQRQGECRHFSLQRDPFHSLPEEPVRHSSRLLSLPTIAWTGSALNSDLIAELGFAAPNRRSRPHVVPWLADASGIKPLRLEKPPVTYDRFRILFIGQCLFRKGLLRLLNALHMAALPEWQLTVVTSCIREGNAYDYNGRALTGPAATILHRALRQHNVRVLPANLPPSQMIELLRQSHLYVCPSVSDNGPNTVIESVALGTPVVVSDMSGAVEAVPQEFRHTWNAPHWWKGDSRPGCEEELAGIIRTQCDELFLRRRVWEYGCEQQHAFFREDWLDRLFREYRFVLSASTRS
jgi:glycosyltransferase involved in cell wall biosynthesis